MRLFGIKVRLHWTYIFFCLPIFFADMSSANFLAIAARNLAIICIYAFIVLGHELSHALMARKFGFKTREIILHMLGGLAIIEGIGTPQSPKMTPIREILIAFAGPLFNFVVAFIAIMIGIATQHSFGISLNDLYSLFIVTNIGIGLFNLLPAYPMDGGRILLGILKILKVKEANKIMKGVAGVIGLFLFTLGVLSLNPMLSLIGFFLVLGAYSKALWS